MRQQWEQHIHQVRSGMEEVKLPRIPDRVFQVTSYGAAGDGITDNTAAFTAAIEDCHAQGGGKVIIPAGIWLTGPLQLKSKLNLHVEPGALVLFSPKFSDYPLVQSHYEGRVAVRCQSPLDGEGLEDVAVTGGGIFDGSGEAWRPVKSWKMTAAAWHKLLESGGAVDKAQGTWWPAEEAMQGEETVRRLEQQGIYDVEAYESVRAFLRPNLLSLRHCKRLLLEGPTFQNSAAWCVHPLACEQVTLRHVTIRNPWHAQNGDGLDLESCRYVKVEHCSFDVGDDAICLKSGKDAAGREFGIPSEYIAIRDCVVYHGHGGIVVGSEMSGGVKHVHVSDCTFIGTDIGIRFKSTRGRGGVVEYIALENIRMNNMAEDAISFNLYYEGLAGSGDLGAYQEVPVTEETPIFRHIYMRDIICTGAKRALLVNGLPEMPVEDVVITDSSFITQEGIILRYADSLTMRRVRLSKQQGSLAELHQCRNLELCQVTDLSCEDGESLAVVFNHE